MTETAFGQTRRTHSRFGTAQSFGRKSGFPSPTERGRSDIRAGSLATAVTKALAWTTVASLWFLAHPFPGIRLDSRVYIGRALADLHPATVGRDLMFVHDGQSPFSLFTSLTRALAAALGADRAAALLAFAGTSLWLIAIVVLARRLVRGPVVWAVLVFAAILPATYGGFAIIPFGEAIAVPRPFAEAGVLAALAALICRQRVLALGLLAAAAVFHPIMALAGFGVFFLMLGFEDWRWLVAGAAVAGLAFAAAALGAPLANRLFAPVDPAWLDLLHRRNPYLFPLLWPASSWGRAAVQAVTVLITASLFQGRARSALLATLSVAAGGVLLTIAMGDLYPSLLVLQAQPWRALWLVGALGSAGLAICAVELWRKGANGRLVLAFLVIGWLGLDNPLTALPACGLALALHWRGTKAAAPVSRLTVQAVWLLACLAGLLSYGKEAEALGRLLAAKPLGATIRPTALLDFGFHVVPIALATIWVVMTQAGRLGRARPFAMGALAVGAAAAAVLNWNTGSGPQSLAGGGPNRELTRLLSSRPGEVFWPNSDTETWLLADRANWASELQGASIVFSREQAMQWQDRMRILVAAGLASPHIFTPWDGGDIRPPIPVTTAAVSKLCKRPDAPAWIVAPLLDGAPAPRAAGIQFWKPAETRYQVNMEGSRFVWRRTHGFAVIPCAGAQSPGKAVPNLRPMQAWAAAQLAPA